MLLRDTLIAISEDARGWLTHWTRDFTPAESTRSGGVIHPLAWQLGHLAASEDWAYSMVTGATPIVDPSLGAICGNGCPAPTDATVFPTLEELWALLGRTHARVIELARKTSDADYDTKAARDNPFFKTIGQSIYELALHENYHVGEIGVLRRAIGKPPIA